MAEGKVVVLGPVRLGNPAVIVHGGAGGWSRDRLGKVEEAVRTGAARGLETGSAVEAIAALEDSGVLNAGVGSVLTFDGRVEMDAGIMYGDYKAGAVAAVTYPRNPIRLADWVARNTPHVIIAGRQADRLAETLGLEPHPGPSPGAIERWRRLRENPRGPIAEANARLYGGDTVGAVVVNGSHVAAGASTGGVALKLPGRVGDSPIPGAGFYAVDGLGGCAATGIGETIILGRPCLRALDLLAQGLGVEEAARRAVEEHTSIFGPDNLGIIVLDASGSAAAAMNTEGMPVGYAGSLEKPKVLVMLRGGHKH